MHRICFYIRCISLKINVFVFRFDSFLLILRVKWFSIDTKTILVNEIVNSVKAYDLICISFYYNISNLKRKQFSWMDSSIEVIVMVYCIVLFHFCFRFVWFFFFFCNILNTWISICFICFLFSKSRIYLGHCSGLSRCYTVHNGKHKLENNFIFNAYVNDVCIISHNTLF